MKKLFLALIFFLNISAFADCQTSYDKLFSNYSDYVSHWNRLSDYLKRPRTSDQYHEKYLFMLKSGNDYIRQALEFKRACGALMQDQDHIPDIIKGIEEIKVYSGCILFEERNLKFIEEVSHLENITETEKAKAKAILNVYKNYSVEFYSKCQFYHDDYQLVTESIMRELENIIW